MSMINNSPKILFFYNIIPLKSLGNNVSFLLYSSQNELVIGSVVNIPIKNNWVLGLVLSIEHNIDHYNLQNIKEVGESKSIYFCVFGLKFLELVASNTFNSVAIAAQSMFKPFELLNQKQIKELQEYYNNGLPHFVRNDSSAKNDDKTKNFESKYIPNSKKTTSETQSNLVINKSFDQISTYNKNISQNQNHEVNHVAKVEFELTSDYFIRIIYIIRSVIDNFNNNQKYLKQSKNSNILIIFPELKNINYYYQLIIKQLDQNLENLENINLTTFESKKTKVNQNTVLDVVSNNKLNIILGSKSSIFLPFQSIQQVILIDEANSFYIQEQNSMYYDARDVVFLLAKAYNCNLNFISKVPSIRLHNFYSKELLTKYVSMSSQDNKIPPNIKITKNSPKHSSFELFGYDVEKLLPKKL